MNWSRCCLGGGLWVGPRKYVVDTGAHWHHLANTSEPSVCSGDAVLCQITLTTLFVFTLHYLFSQAFSRVVIGQCSHLARLLLNSFTRVTWLCLSCRNFFMTQFVDNENLSKNTLLEIDMAEMTRPHLTGAHQSCGLSVLSLYQASSVRWWPV